MRYLTLLLFFYSTVSSAAAPFGVGNEVFTEGDLISVVIVAVCAVCFILGFSVGLKLAALL